jgi:hypothetical protein
MSWNSRTYLAVKMVTSRALESSSRTPSPWASTFRSRVHWPTSSFICKQFNSNFKNFKSRIRNQETVMRAPSPWTSTFRSRVH